MQPTDVFGGEILKGWEKPAIPLPTEGAASWNSQEQTHKLHDDDHDNGTISEVKSRTGPQGAQGNNQLPSSNITRAEQLQLPSGPWAAVCPGCYLEGLRKTATCLSQYRCGNRLASSVFCSCRLGVTYRIALD